MAQQASHVSRKRCHFSRSMTRVSGKVKVPFGRVEEPAPVHRRKTKGHPAHNRSQRSRCRWNALTVLLGPPLSYGKDKPTHRLRIPRKPACVAVHLVKRARDRCDEDSMALQPSVHVSHSIHAKAGLSKQRNHVLSMLFHDGRLPRNVNVANNATFSDSRDSRNAKTTPTL